MRLFKVRNLARSDSWRAGLAGFVLAGGIAVTAVAQPVYRKALLLGEPLAAGAGSFSSTFESTIGAGGHVVIRGTRSTIGGIGVAVGLPGQAFTLVAATGSTAPGIPANTVINLFTDSWPDSAGRVMIGADISGPGVTTTNNKCHWIFDGGAGGMQLVVREGSQAPGLPAGTVFSTIGNPAFANGRMAFESTLSGGGTTSATDRSLWLYNGTSLVLLAREGSASGVVAGANWADFGEPLMNEAGQLAFVAKTNSGLGTDSIIVTGAPGSFVLAAREGSAAAGTPAGVVFIGDFASPNSSQAMGYNNAGGLAYRGTVSGTGINTANDRTLHARFGGVTSLVVREGDLTPGLPQVAPQFGEPSTIQVGGAGIVAWTTEIDGLLVTPATNTRVYRRIESQAPQLRVVLSEGAQVPRAAAGVVFGSSATTYQPDYAINASGIMLMQALVQGPGVTANARVLVVNDPADPVTFPIGREGDAAQLQFAAATGGTIVAASANFFTSTQTGRPTSINDAGDAALNMSVLADSAGGGVVGGVFVTSMSAASAVGACCRGATCLSLPASACTGGGARFGGISTACNAAGNTSSPCCTADFNGVGGVTVQDMFDYLNAYFASDLLADANASGGLSVQDIFDFLEAYFAGCA